MPDQTPRESRLTHSQLQLWIGQRMSPSSPLYNMAFSMVFSGELRGDLFEQAWQRVVDGSDALRTSVREQAGVGVPCVRPRGSAALEILDFSRRPEALAAFHRWCRQRCYEPLSIEGSLVDSVLVKLGDDAFGWYLNQHHLIADAWSTVLVYQQVAAEYLSLLTDTDRPDALPPYYPTARALEADPAEAAGDSASEHWSTRRALQDRSTPFYGASGEPTGTKSVRLTFRIEEEQSRQIDRLCKQPGFESLSGETSRFALFAALLSSWLYRISGKSDLGFDAPVGGRPTSAAKRSIGLFIEMFPFAVSVDPEDTFRTLGAKCLEEARLFLLHSRPGTSAPARGNASNVVLNYLPVSFGEFAGIPVDVEWIHPGHGDGVHALRLQVHDFSASGRYTLHFDFNVEAVPERLRHRSLAHFEAILSAMLEDPDRLIASVDISTAEEKRDLALLNATDAEPLPDETVVAMFERQAEATPDRAALRDGDEEVSFSRLLQDVEALALTLVERHVEAGDRVAILAPRSRLAVTAVLATLRAGAAYVPIDTRYPRERVEQIVRDAGARMILGAETTAESGKREGASSTDAARREREEPWSPPRGVTLLPIDAGIRAGRGRPLRRDGPDLEDLAYLIYTSGSSGRPKGVAIEHGGLADYLRWASRRYVRGTPLTFPLFTSLSFDLTITSLFLPLITGGTLEIYAESAGPVDTAVIDVVKDNKVDFIKLTPSHLSLLRQLDLRASRIRRMVVGGEDFLTHLAASIHDQFAEPVEIHNEYGPTEAVVGCVAHEYDPELDVGARVPIGSPADHVEVQILNEVGVLVPDGVPGELWISRHGLARGYHGREDLTTERFRHDFVRPGSRFYRTGDRVRLVTPQTLEYLGRLDRQVKIAGFRVEPGEIESAILSAGSIEQCAVVARPRTRRHASSGGDPSYCVRCGLPSDYPGTEFDEDGICGICHSYDSIAEHAQRYFRSMGDLEALFEESRRSGPRAHDCMMLLSGGKDSTYALCRLVEMGLSVYAFTLDNGFISDGAKDNMRRVTEELGVPLEFASTPAMNAIFRDSLLRFSNVCHGCFKTIYTLSMTRARALEIPIIVTGLSRGQMFETRLTEELFRDGQCSPAEVDAAVLAARKVYHRVEDEVSRSLDVSIFADDRIFEDVRFVDFYRYCDAGLEEVLTFLDNKVPWVRPADTGRSTNCLINDAGIHVHKQERGFHNYALAYSWDVRLGHKNRDAALDELNDDLDTGRIREILQQVGYDQVSSGSESPILGAFYVSSEEVPESHLRRHLEDRLPSQFMPLFFRRVGSIPLTTNGKVDESALPWPEPGAAADAVHAPVEGPVQEFLSGLWQEQLGIDAPGSASDFFALGGTSLAAMEVMLRLCREFDLDLPLETLFTHPTIAALASVAEEAILADVAANP